MISTREGNLLSFMTSAGTYREDVFQRDLLLIQAHYWDRGYVQVKVGEPAGRAVARQAVHVHHDPDRRGAAVPARARSTSRASCSAPREYFLQRVSVKTGEIFNRSKLSDDLQKLTDYYKDHGYAYVNVTPTTPINEKTRTVDVTFEIQKGPLVTFERINIRGNTKTRDKVIRREMRISEGEIYNQTSARLLEAARHRARLLREGRRLDQARVDRRQDRRQRRGRGAADRHVPDRRRLLVGRELHRPGADLAEQPVRPRPDADAAGAALQPAPAVPAAVPGPLLPRHQVDVRLQPVQAGPVPVLVRALVEAAGRSPGATCSPRTRACC